LSRRRASHGCSDWRIVLTHALEAMEAGMTDFKFDPRRTALLNIDMQNCFVENSPVAAPRGREIVPRINKLAEVCRKRGVLVIHTLHLVRPDGSNTGVMGVIIPAIAAGLINKGNKQAELHPDIVVGKNDILLEKPRYGAFHGTDLDLILRNRGVDTVIVTGICTNVCCETTVREANIKVFFISDATATFNTPEVSADQIQPVVLATLKAAFAQIENTASMIRKLEEYRSAFAA
jgi:nicotinamidase-related amidase